MALNLRDHPLVSRRSRVKIWPPLWSSTGQERKDWPIDEVGTLRETGCMMAWIPALFLFIDYNGPRYFGSMYFDDVAFCYEVDALLKFNPRRSIKEIGDLDVTRLL